MPARITPKPSTAKPPKDTPVKPPPFKLISSGKSAEEVMGGGNKRVKPKVRKRVLKIVYRKGAELVKNPRNVKLHSEPQLMMIARSIKKFGFTNPILMDEDDLLIAGHGRLEAGMVFCGMVEFPTITIDGLSEAEKRGLMLADNNIQEQGEWDEAALSKELLALDALGFDIHDAGFTLSDIDLSLADPQARDESIIQENDPDEIDPEWAGVATFNEDMIFEKGLPFDIPPFRRDMLGDIPDDIATWCGVNYYKPEEYDPEAFFWIWRADSLRGMPKGKPVVSFYTDDSKFECMWESPADSARRLLAMDPVAVISPNYSMWYEWPQAQKVWSTYRARWVGRYLQECGLKVIPDVAISGPASFEWCLAGVPHGAPCVSMQIQTAEKTADEISVTRELVRRVVDELQPQKLLIYVWSPNYQKILRGTLPKDLKVVIVNNRLRVKPMIEAGGPRAAKAKIIG